jgi:hypothetical protein
MADNYTIHDTRFIVVHAESIVVGLISFWNSKFLIFLKKSIFAMGITISESAISQSSSVSIEQ